MSEWHKEQLRNNKLLVRGELDPDDPFTFKFELYILRRKDDHEWLIRCTYWREDGYNNRFPDMGCTDWKSAMARWHQPWFYDRLLVISDRAGREIAPIHYLSQLYGLTEAIDLTPPGVGGWSEERSTLLKRLRAAYREQVVLVQQAVGKP